MTPHPHAALDMQLRLWEARTDRLADLGHRVNQDRAGLPVTGTAGPVRRWGIDPGLAPLHALDASLAGQTMWIAEHMVATIEQAAASIPPPDGQISAEMIPAPAGTAWWPGDPLMVCTGASGDEALPLVGVGWSVAMTELGIHGATGAATVPAVTIIPWVRPDTPLALPWCDTPVPSPLSPSAAKMIGVDAPTAGVSPDLSTDWGEPWMECLRFVLAMWVFAAQVLPQHVESASRPQRRRADRLFRPRPSEWGDVHVLTLRTQHHDAEGSADDDDTTRAPWSHRWIVRGHWRWQPCGPGRSDRRLTWIRPHIKGPDNAPLIEVEQVAKLIR